MHNYYEYCNTISKEYYPRIYKELEYNIENTIKKIDKEALHPFPRSREFENIVDNVFKEYKNQKYHDFLEGKKECINFTNEESLSLVKDMIRILLINRIMKDREAFKDYPYYY